jgi:hypothetical protein
VDDDINSRGEDDEDITTSNTTIPSIELQVPITHAPIDLLPLPPFETICFDASQ